MRTISAEWHDQVVDELKGKLKKALAERDEWSMSGFAKLEEITRMKGDLQNAMRLLKEGRELMEEYQKENEWLRARVAHLEEREGVRHA